MKAYTGFIPPCGIFCGGCPRYLRGKNPCPGAEQHCRKRRCKGIYICCVEKKGLTHCYECPCFPCSRFRKFAQTWEQYEQNLIENQRTLQTIGSEEFLRLWNGLQNKA